MHAAQPSTHLTLLPWPPASSIPGDLRGEDLVAPLSPPLPSPDPPPPEASADEACLSPGMETAGRLSTWREAAGLLLRLARVEVVAATHVAPAWCHAAHGRARGRGAQRWCEHCWPLDGAEVPCVVCWISRRRGGCRGGEHGAPARLC